MSLKTLGIIGAMAEEVAILAELLEDSTTTQHAGSTFHVGQLHGLKIVLLQSGIGKVNAAVGACEQAPRTTTQNIALTPREKYSGVLFLRGCR